MYRKLKKIEYDKLKVKGTGGRILRKGRNEIKYPLGKYEVTIQLSPDNKFIGISEIRINKDFRSYKQRIVTKGFHDVEEFYKE
jgi:hypothetical protein